MKPREVWSLAEAREALTRLIGRVADWTELDSWLIEYGVEPKLRRTARASSFSASLELVREGLIELRQDAGFAPLYLRGVARRSPAPRLDQGSTTELGSYMGVVTQLFDNLRRRVSPRRTCASPRRCCSPPPSRLDEATIAARLSPRLRRRRGDGRAAAPVRRARRQSRARRRALDVSHRARSRLAARARGAGEAQAVARGDRDARHHRLSPAGHPRRHRGYPRRRRLQGRARRADGGGLGAHARPPQGAGPADHLRHDAGLPRSISASTRSPICPGSTSCRARACSTASCRPGSACRSPTMLDALRPDEEPLDEPAALEQAWGPVARIGRALKPRSATKAPKSAATTTTADARASGRRRTLHEWSHCR